MFYINYNIYLPEIQAFVSKYKENTDTAVVLTARRLSTVKSCDNIIVLDDGKAAEQGMNDELIVKQRYFYVFL